MRPSSIRLILSMLLIDRINGFGFLGFGGSAVKEISTSADILKSKLVNKSSCNSTILFTYVVNNVHLNN